MNTHYSQTISDAYQSGGTFNVTCPYDDSILASVDMVGDALIEEALSAAHALYRDRSRWLDASRRIEILSRTAELMSERAEEFAVQAASEGGKPLMDSRVEVTRAIEGVHLCIDAIKNNAGRQYPMGINASSSHKISFSVHEPIGVVVAVSAFNHPLNLIIHQVGPAVAAGCPVLIKPARSTPISCFHFVELLREAGLPKEWCQVVIPENNAQATTMVSDSRVAFFSFIGSAAVGWMLRSKLAPGARCALEHGGVAPVIVAADAKMDEAIDTLAKGGFYHAGQVCVSVQRVFVDESKVDQFAHALADKARALKVGDPRDASTEVGPLISPSEVDRIHRWVTEAVEQGATLLCGGEKLPHNCYAPTVLLNPPADCTISITEVFGPVVCVYSSVDQDAAIAQANSLDFAFQAAVWTTNLDTAMHCFTNLDASAVMINEHTAFRVDWMPFAGLKKSGHGVGGIEFTFEEMQISKMAILKSPSL